MGQITQTISNTFVIPPKNLQKSWQVSKIFENHESLRICQSLRILKGQPNSFCKAFSFNSFSESYPAFMHATKSQGKKSLYVQFKIPHLASICLCCYAGLEISYEIIRHDFSARNKMIWHQLLHQGCSTVKIYVAKLRLSYCSFFLLVGGKLR